MTFYTFPFQIIFIFMNIFLCCRMYCIYAFIQVCGDVLQSLSYKYNFDTNMIHFMVDIEQLVLPFLRKDDRVVKLSKWGEGYLFSLPAAIRFIDKVYQIGINKHSDTWIRDCLQPILVTNISYSLVIGPNKGNIYNSGNVNNAKDFPYKAAYGNSNILLSLLGFAVNTEEKIIIESDTINKDLLLFSSLDDKNLPDVCLRLINYFDMINMHKVVYIR